MTVVLTKVCAAPFKDIEGAAAECRELILTHKNLFFRPLNELGPPDALLALIS